MVSVSFGLRGERVLAKAGGALFPLCGTISLFAALYNNLYCGWLIYLILILSNLSILLIPAPNLRIRQIVASARLTSLCLTFALLALSGLEIVFPWVLPADYVQTRDLAKTFMNVPLENRPVGSVVFDNPDQKILDASSGFKNRRSQFKVWHAPGKEFAYYGYDPNSRLKYVNAFHWNSSGYFDHDYDLRKTPGVHRIVVVGDS